MSESAAAKSWTAAKWVPVVQSAGVLSEMLGQAKNDQARAIAVGKFLSGKVGQEVPVAHGGRTGKAVLRSAGGRARQKTYFFEVTWDSTPPSGPASAGAPDSSTAPKAGHIPRKKAKTKKKSKPPGRGAGGVKPARRRDGGNDE